MYFGYPSSLREGGGSFQARDKARDLTALIDRLFPPSTYSNRILETQTRSNSPQRSPAVGRLEIHPLANKSSPPLLSWTLR
ncbi:hypothetical protein FOBRF1_000896 [Fusarium oxysporum]